MGSSRLPSTTASDPAIVVLTERELFGERVQQTRRRKRAARDPEAIVRDLSELSIGAPIVHVDHGVGRYQGLLKLDVGGENAEFLSIEYAKGDKLYVPVAQLHLVSRYSGTAPELAPLHALGGDAWERAKRKAAEKVRDVAAELLAIYAQREARQGTAMPVDREMAEQFAAAKIPFIFDPGQGLPMFGKEDLQRFVSQATWVAVNEYEWQMLQQKTGWTVKDVVSQVDALIVTLGSQGSAIHTKDGPISIPCAAPKAVVDPTGCGDAYRAGILHGLLHGLDWKTTGRIASLMGAIKIETRGPQNHRFTRSEFEQRLAASFGA